MDTAIGCLDTAEKAGEVGSMIGSGVGSVLPGVGTATGGAIGGAVGAITGEGMCIMNGGSSSQQGTQGSWGF